MKSNTLASGQVGKWESGKRLTRSLAHPLTCGLLLLLLLQTGCARLLMPSASQLEALAKDTNSIQIEIISMYGTVRFYRNIGMATNSGSVLITPTTTLKTQPVQ